MKIKGFIVCVLISIGSIMNSQCTLNEMQVELSECHNDGTFSVQINFNHSETSDSFRILGNGVNYGIFAYSNLPITIDNLAGNCTTNYEFVARDKVTENCAVFKNVGKKCCTDMCEISIKNVETSSCNGSLYTLSFDLDHSNTPETGFDVFNNGVHFGYYKYPQLPLRLENVPSSTSEEYNTIVVCANDRPNCCDTVKILNPCICSIRKVQAQVLNCNEDSKTFSLKLNFKHSLTSDSFQLGGNSFNYGKFAYSQLPITINGLHFSDSLEYEFLIVDKNDPYCFGTYALGIVKDCHFECGITDVVATPEPCVDGLFYVNLHFNSNNPSVSGFIVRGNGHNYGNFEYGEDSYRVGPLEGNCTTLYEFVVIDREMESCRGITNWTEPICCDTPCEMSNLKITEYCENNDLVAFDVNFDHSRTTGSFVLRINTVLVGTYQYADLPIKITNINFDLPNISIRIYDSEKEVCHINQDYSFECYVEPMCNIYDMDVKATDCNNDNRFYAILKFKVSNHGSKGFRIKVNGETWGTKEYGHDLYEIGPLHGDCSTIYHILIQDIEFENCAEDINIGPICCNQDCSITNQSLTYSECEDGKFDVHLNFSHQNTAALRFNLKINGVSKGLYYYTDLPVLIENLSEKTTYEIVVFDAELESCRLGFAIPKVECTSATQEQDHQQISWTTDNQTLFVQLDEKYIPSEIKILNLDGQAIYTQTSTLYNQLNISNLPIGVYVFQVVGQKELITRKFVKY